MQYAIIFTSGYRPLEDHFEGLLYSINKENNFRLIIFLEENSEQKIFDLLKKYRNTNISILSKFNILTIFRYAIKSTLIFGKPKGIKKFVLFFSQLLNRKVTRIILTPGIILKATGHFKSKRKLLNFILYVRNFVFNKFFKFIVLTPTNEGMLYQAAAFAYPINLVVNYPLPKNIYLTKKIKQNYLKKIVLFSPTHRWNGIKSPIELILEDEDFVKSIIDLGFLVKYTLHPEQEMNVKSNFSKGVKPFKKEWEKVFSLITDYSSIGLDYLYSGGKNLVYFTPDIDQFQLRQGIGPLFKSHLQLNYNFFSKEQIIKFLSNQKNYENIKDPNKKISLSFSMQNYYTNLQEILKGL
tara:strand:- start:1976 stop:3034 length:1059 start_codon:yes stop_codon:yes gene_type:complete